MALWDDQLRFSGGLEHTGQYSMPLLMAHAMQAYVAFLPLCWLPGIRKEMRRHWFFCLGSQEAAAAARTQGNRQIKATVESFFRSGSWAAAAARIQGETTWQQWNATVQSFFRSGYRAAAAPYAAAAAHPSREN